MQFLSSRSTILIKRVFEVLVVLALPHPTGHINHCGCLVPNQIAFNLGLAIVNGIGHHLTQGVGPAYTVRITEHAACLYDDTVLGAQVAVRIMDIFRPLLHGLILAPPGDIAACAVIALAQAVQ